MVLEGNLSNNLHVFKMADGEKLVIKGGTVEDTKGQFINVRISNNQHIDIRADKVLYHQIIRGDEDENN